MPKVPVLSPEIRPQVTPEVSPAPMRPPPPGAFGGDVAQAAQRQGDAVQQTGDVIWQRMMEHQERENAQQNMDVQTQFQKDVQNTLINPELDDNNMPKGLLNRSLNQAKGATVAFDQQAVQLKQKYMGMVASPVQKQQMNTILSTHLTAARESVVSHEAQQTQKAFDDSFQANMKQTVGSAANIADPAMLGKYIDAAESAAEPGWKHAGLGGVDVDHAKKGYAAEIVKSALTPLLDRDPKAAQSVLDANKDRLTPLDVAQIQNQIDLKHAEALGASFWAEAKTHHTATGEVDLAFAEHLVESSKLPQEIKDKALSYVHSRATFANAELNQFHDTNMRQAMVDMFDGKLTRSEVERRYREGLLSKENYTTLDGHFNSGYFQIRALDVSDPEAFNAIRQAQLTGSASPGEIQRMIVRTAPNLRIDDQKYLTQITSEKPPTERDKYIESQGQSLIDFGHRYFSESFLGIPIKKENTSKAAQAIATDFYNAVDKSKAQGEDIDQIRDRVLKTAIAKTHPGIVRLEKMPDVVIDVKGRVTRLLNPDQHSGLKPRYRITPAGTDKDEQRLNK
jgi:hypothetical protein